MQENLLKTVFSFLIFYSFFICPIALAQASSLGEDMEISKDEAIQAMAEMVAQTPLSKGEMIKIIDQMAASGQISAQEATEGKKMMGQMSESDIAQMKKVIIEMMTKKLKTMNLSNPLKKP